MDKKFIALLVVVALGGGMIGSVVTAGWAQADIFSDIYNNLVKPILPPANNNSVSSTSQTNQSAPSGKYQSNVEYENAVMDSVSNASPAVVSIIISKNVPVVEQCPYNPFSDLPPEFQQFFGFGGGAQFYQPCQKGTKLQEVGGGSGFIISSDGLILTNKHVVADTGASYTVMTNDGNKYDATVVARDPVVDLAIVKINKTGLPTLTLGDSDSLRLGQTAIAIGNALGEFRNTVSVGVISGLARTITAQDSTGAPETIAGVIQTDAAINAGNSGGPLLNLRGEVIGINVAMVSGAQSIGFSIPINQAKQAIDSVKKTGKIITPYLGVRNITVTTSVAKDKNLSVDYGALISGDANNPAVVKNSPADKAGLKSKDIILEVDGKKITSDYPLSSVINQYSVGDTITLKILRDGKEMEVKVTLEQRPQ